MQPRRIAVIIPCYNEELTIVKVVKDCKSTIPNAVIYVINNNSTDNSAELAEKAGATVYNCTYQGKGNVIRYAFTKIDADIYIIADGDDQCDMKVIPDALKKFISEDLDMLNLIRVADSQSSYRYGHAWGNKILTGLANFLFQNKCSDILGGYRLFSKRYAKSFPGHSKGFEIEIELSIFAYQMRLPTSEIQIPYRARPIGSVSKLHTIKDGIRILLTIIYLFTNEKPITFFGGIASIFGILGLYWIIDIWIEFLKISAVPRFPTLIFAVTFLLLSLLLLTTGLMIHYIQRNTFEQRRYAYLNVEEKN
ncbi:Glycosyltransferase involved in cell wall bisynthesis [Brevinema andersonii]|uniref:Glycosyltransferase involved in cell wall bisynthesis n=1 Tax=Brevinema andersonii TaxID=34097 RepID=A0A1I1DP69_BREAD|nr:glycosyltransferase family 2 protein [Brevinema andersonii]SFB76755.1 Glycosyltransferase involved in cell wall bisynthesis [Brevinema andersonii]